MEGSFFRFENVWPSVIDFGDKVIGWWWSYAVEGRLSLKSCQEVEIA